MQQEEWHDNFREELTKFLNSDAVKNVHPYKFEATSRFTNDGKTRLLVFKTSFKMYTVDFDDSRPSSMDHAEAVSLIRHHFLSDDLIDKLEKAGIPVVYRADSQNTPIFKPEKLKGQRIGNNLSHMRQVLG